MATLRPPGLVLTDHTFTVPLDHARPDGEQIEIYAREAVAPRKERETLPWLCFFQGGPGGKSPRPLERGDWLRRALEDYRVLLLDQRGTGRSSPADRHALGRRGDAAAQADYLRHFRADAIVRDAEHIRRELLGPDGRWSVLGQSYGGFCVVRYLSAAPEGLAEALITGGLPPLRGSADDVYARTYPKAIARSAAFYERYPEDRRRAAEIMDHLLEHDVRLLSGDPLKPERFQQLGHGLGMKPGYERVHYLLEEAWSEPGERLSDTFLQELEVATSFATQPLYAILHEPIYCQEEASLWSAQRLRERFPELDPRHRPVHFSGEMIYPWMFEVDSTLRPLREAANLLAERDDWPRLYDPERLAANEVPCAAAVYHDDLYVDRELSLETAAAIKGLRVWITNEYEHDGLRQSGEKVLGRLIDMVHGEA